MPRLVKPVVSIFGGEETVVAAVVDALSVRLGRPDYESVLLDVHHTQYYEKEMGTGLLRRLYSFSRLIEPEGLAVLKRWTVSLEDRWKIGGRRQANIDPGYLTLAKLVLATTKNNIHRIYLGEGIFAEVTLFYRQGHFHPWLWTYPDYASVEYRTIFEQIRKLYRKQISA